MTETETIAEGNKPTSRRVNKGWSESTVRGGVITVHIIYTSTHVHAKISSKLIWNAIVNYRFQTTELTIKNIQTLE